MSDTQTPKDQRVGPAPAGSGVVEKDGALDAIPSSWLDPLLSGHEKALEGKPGTWNCADIERLLLAIRARINRLPNAMDEGRRTQDINTETDKL